MKSFLLSAGLLLSALLVAAPKAEWIPANADIVTVSVELDQKNLELQETYLRAFRAAGVRIPEKTADTQQEFADICPGFDLLVKELAGVNEDWQSLRLRSFLVAVVLPSAPGANDMKLFCYAELPGFNQAAADAALQKVFERDRQAQVKRTGAWSRIVSAAEEKQTPFVGYRAIPEGYVFVSVPAQADAEAHLASTAPLPQTSPFRSLFTGLPAVGSRTIVADVKALTNRFVPAGSEGRPALEMQAPWLLQMGSLTADVAVEKTHAALKLSAVMTTADAAILLRDMVNGAKMMIAAFAIPQFTGKMDSAFSKLLMNRVTVSVQQTGVECNVRSTPEELAEILKEMQSLEERFCTSGIPVDVSGEDEPEEGDIETLLEEIDTEEEELTPEEARRILDETE